MANFDTVIRTTETNSDDDILVRQGVVDRKHSRQLLSTGVAEDILEDDLLDATESQKGISERATQAEVDTGTDTERYVTPSTLKSSTATTDRKGVVELATSVETQSGTDTTRCVTPAGLAAVTATETRKGLVERATESEVLLGTDYTRYVTPSTLKVKLDEGERGISTVGSVDATVVTLNPFNETDLPYKAVLHVVMKSGSYYYPSSIPLRFFFFDTTSGSVMVDNSDGTDIRFTYTYASSTITLTATTGTFQRVYVEGKGS